MWVWVWPSSSWRWPAPKRENRMTISSTKNRTIIVINIIPSTQLYSVIGPVRHGLVKDSSAGAKRCIKAVAMITPDPKNFATKKIQPGNPLFLLQRRAKTGKRAPNEEPIKMTKMDDIRKPMRPSNSLPVSQASPSRFKRVLRGSISIMSNSRQENYCFLGVW